MRSRNNSWSKQTKEINMFLGYSDLYQLPEWHKRENQANAAKIFPISSWEIGRKSVYPPYAFPVASKKILTHGLCITFSTWINIIHVNGWRPFSRLQLGDSRTLWKTVGVYFSFRREKVYLFLKTQLPASLLFHLASLFNVLTFFAINFQELNGYRYHGNTNNG